VRILLDTTVLSELRRPRPSQAVVEWFAAMATEELCLSVATIAELERGAAMQRRRDPMAAHALEQWIERALADYGDHILAVDTPVARRWGELAGRLGYDNADLVIAVTALEHEIPVATRDARGFKRTGVTVIDPFGPSGRS
jgi:predicted nucleic acid-binding protein